jgi:enolase
MEYSLFEILICKFIMFLLQGIPLYRHIADLAGVKQVILPVPAFNVINGGSHAGNKLAMQEFMLLPIGKECERKPTRNIFEQKEEWLFCSILGAPNFKEAMRYGSEIYHHLKKGIHQRYGLDATAVGDEGGFAPNIQDGKEVLDLLKEAIDKAGYTGKVIIGMDVAASEFHKEKNGNHMYDLDFKNPKEDDSRLVSELSCPAER